MFFSDADYPGKDISDVVYVSISEKDDKPVHVYIADNSKGQRAVQAYIGTLNVKYPGKVNITWTTLDVIASRYQDSERGSDSNSSQHLNSNQEKVISYLAKANNLGSSDLHITPGRDGSEFTYVEARVHGELEILDVIPRKEGLELLGAAYSGMSDVIKGTQFDPAIPQDARIAENFLKPVNLFGARYSHYPCVGGVYAVFRLIKDDSEDIPTFEELGYMPQQIQTIRRMLQRPEGIIVLSGPTGSGKSTTLRTASEAYLSTFGFNHNDNMRLPRKRLFTIESPPEGRIPGAIQTAVRDSVDGWVDAIKSAMRLDPDAILNGEIRDHASALAAIKASMTGHLLLTTLHANDALNIIERLEMENIQARLIADPLLFIGLLSQRLVQKLCPYCKRTYAEMADKLSTEERKLIEENCLPEQVRLRNLDGCEHCYKGVTGRTVIAEVVSPDARFFQLYRQSGRLEAKSYWHYELGGITRNQHLLHLINHGLVDPLSAHFISPIDEDKYSMLPEGTWR